MPISFYKSYTSGTRNPSAFSFSEITKSTPEKSLTFYKHRSRGRNNRGIITSRHRGGGHKRLFRRVDFKRNLVGLSAIVSSIEYDPNRNARLALLYYQNGAKHYILHPRGLSVGDGAVCDEHLQ